MTYSLIGTAKARGFRVAWALEELGLEYNYIPATPRSKEAFEHNPSGKVPILKVDDAIIPDSIAIITYLADKHGGLTYPAGTLERAQQDSLTHFILDEMDAVLWTAARNSFVNPEDQRVPEIKPVLKWEFARSLKTLEARLGDGPYLTGDKFTIADLLFGHCANWAENAKFDMPDTGKIAEILTRIRGRDGYLRAVELRNQ